MSQIEKYLKHHNISQRGFAKKIGTTPNNLGSIIQGKSMPSLILAYKIEKRTGGLVTVYDFIPEEIKKEIDKEIEDDFFK